MSATIKHRTISPNLSAAFAGADVVMCATNLAMGIPLGVHEDVGCFINLAVAVILGAIAGAQIVTTIQLMKGSSP